MPVILVVLEPGWILFLVCFTPQIPLPELRSESKRTVTHDQTVAYNFTLITMNIYYVHANQNSKYCSYLFSLDLETEYLVQKCPICL